MPSRRDVLTALRHDELLEALGAYGLEVADRRVRTSGKSLLILDEAHNFAPATSSRYAVDSKQPRALRDVAPLFEHRLFLSATPHNGHSNSISALLEILDPQRFCRGVDVVPKQRDEVLVRRLKSDLRDTIRGIPKRVVEQIDVDGLPDDAPELVLARLLDDYRRLGEERTKDLPKQDRAAVGLVVSGLQKRLLSCIDAFAQTHAVHRRTLEKKMKEGGSEKKTTTGKTRKLHLLLATPNADDEGADLSAFGLLHPGVALHVIIRGGRRHEMQCEKPSWTPLADVTGGELWQQACLEPQRGCMTKPTI